MLRARLFSGQGAISMDKQTTKESEPVSRQRQRLWREIVSTTMGLAVSLLASLSVENMVTRREPLVLGVLGASVAILVAQTLLVAQFRKRDAPKRRLKDAVRTAYAEALTGAEVPIMGASHD